MENLQEQTAFPWNIFFGSYKKKYFVERDEGVLIVPNITYDHQREIRTEEECLFKLKQEVLEANGRSDVGAVCMICCEGSKEGKFLFPTCREAHHLFVCLDCLKKEEERGTERIVCPYDRMDRFAMVEYKRILSERQEEFLNQLTVQPTTNTPSVFLLTTTNIPDNPTLLTEQTTVSLENIAVSEDFFFVLLSKTKVRIGENFSLFGDKDGEDCIAEHGMARNTPVLLKKKQNELITPLFLENIDNIPPNSIGCTFGKFLVNISTRFLTKLRISEVSDFEYLIIEMEKEEHLREILAMEDKSFFIGERRAISLRGYAVNILPKLAFHENNEIEFLILEIEKEEHFRGIPDMKNESIFVAKPRTISLDGYAVGMLPKINFREDNKTKSIFMEAGQEECIIPILGMENESIFVVKTETITLKNYAVSILPKLNFHEDNETGILFLFADLREHVRLILDMGDRSIFVGKAGVIFSEKYAINTLSKLIFHKDTKLCCG
ncbi:MAG: uncharacterized protein A8A55_2108 [Amphiamblys sp. WSBS2006]|nr:MAG: uncharacterized protein A8A55_2108 [Amphiamblys sp. WSBS2006]